MARIERAYNHASAVGPPGSRDGSRLRDKASPTTADRHVDRAVRIRQSAGMPGDLGDNLEAALEAIVRTVDAMPGAYRAEFSLEYWAGVESAESRDGDRAVLWLGKACQDS